MAGLDDEAFADVNLDEAGCLGNMLELVGAGARGLDVDEEVAAVRKVETLEVERLGDVGTTEVAFGAFSPLEFQNVAKFGAGTGVPASSYLGPTLVPRGGCGCC